jgi:uncharacterized integral membrane protein
MNLKLTLILILSSMAVVFVAQNAAVVEIGFLYWRVSISSSLLIFFSIMMGFVVAWFLRGFLLSKRSG